MSDPLSIIGSAVGIVSLGITVAQGLIDYYDGFRDKRSDLLFTTRRLGRLLKVLQALEKQTLNKRTLDTQPASSVDQKLVPGIIGDYIEDSKELIEELKSELDKFRSTEHAGAHSELRATGRRLVYPLRRSTLQKLDENIDTLTKDLSFALKLLEKDDIDEILSDLGDTKALLHLTRASQISQTLITWLKAPDASIDFNEAAEKKHPNTGNWLIKGSDFTSWLDTPHSFLWLVGFAGCGKSVLCSTAIRAALVHRRGNPHIGIAYFYFTFNDQSKQDASAMLRTLILQLSSQASDNHSVLSRLHDEYPTAVPPRKALIYCLRQLIQSFSDVYIVVDALDESPKNTHRETTLDIITELRALPESKLHLIVSSRDEPDIRESLDAKPEEVIGMKNESVDGDIESFISQHLKENRRLRKWEACHKQIEEALTKGAQGVFRWVECQFKELASCPRSEDLLEKRLASLPPTLDETYARMLSRIPHDYREYARQILALLCCAERPLTVEELAVAVAFHPEDNPRFYAKRKLEDVNAIHEACPGFVEISAFEIANSEITLARLAHFSVREYLESDRILQDSGAAAFSIKPQDANALMTRICLSFFLDLTVPISDPRKAPLIDYAAQNWPGHFRRVDTITNQHRLEEQVFQLFSGDNDTFEAWAKAYRPWKYIWHSGIQTPLYASASLGLEGITTRLLEVAGDTSLAFAINKTTALSVASHEGHRSIAELLLQHGANIDMSEALLAAADSGHEDILELLLNRGAAIDAQDTDGKTALHEACAAGHEEIVQLLLDRGAAIDVQDKKGETALHEACIEGHKEIVRLLLDRGAAIGITDEDGCTGLYVACVNEHDSVVKLLLKKGHVQMKKVADR
ncbi:hypothetical protein ACHAPJ_004681 [Fusarium lateritium]